MGERLSAAQRDLLKLLARGPRNEFTDLRIIRVLASKDLVEERFPGTWGITPAGRLALNEDQAKGG